MVSGLGGLHSPKHADIKGLKGFEGPVFHTAEWPDGFDLKGRRVAIIGTGASAAQVLPAIADDVAEVTVFQRLGRLGVPTACATFRRRRGHASADIRG